MIQSCFLPNDSAVKALAAGCTRLAILADGVGEDGGFVNAARADEDSAALVAVAREIF